MNDDAAVIRAVNPAQPAAAARAYREHIDVANTWRKDATTSSVRRHHIHDVDDGCAGTRGRRVGDATMQARADDVGRMVASERASERRMSKVSALKASQVINSNPATKKRMPNWN